MPMSHYFCINIFVGTRKLRREKCCIGETLIVPNTSTPNTPNITDKYMLFKMSLTGYRIGVIKINEPRL